MLEYLTTAGIFGPLAASGTGVAIGRYQAGKLRRLKEGLAVEVTFRRERDEVLKDSAPLRPEYERWSRGKGVGQIALLADGTAAADKLPATLESFVRTDTEDYIKVIFLAEPDVDVRNRCLKDIPEIFRGRIVALDLPLYGGGLLGRTVEEALESRIQQRWIRELKDTTTLWLTRLRNEASPVFLWVILSPGGSGVLARHPIERFSAEYPQAYVYVELVLDHKTDRRELNLPPLLDHIAKDDLVKGLLGEDNKHNRQRTELVDQAMGLLLPSMVASTWIDARPQAGFNVLADVFRRHQLATISVWSGYLPVSYHPAWSESVPEVWYTSPSFAQAQAIHGINEVRQQPSLQALPLERADRPEFVYVIAPIRPDPHMRQIADRVRGSLNQTLPDDTTLGFASVAYPLTPDTQEVPIAVVSVFPVNEGLDGLKELALGRAVPDKFLNRQP